MGCCADEYLIENDIKEIQRTLSEMFDYHCRMSYPLNTSLREIRFAAEAEFNIVLRQEALPAAIWMKERFNIPYVFSDCYGIQEMKKLLPYADVLTPNLTEACRILDLDYHKVDLSEEGLVAICEALSDMGPSRIVITGLQQGDLIFNYIFEKNKTSELLSTRKIGGDRSGTGDVFSSIVTGALIQGQDFKTAVKRAVTFLDKAIAYTAQMELPWNYGICFEEYLEEI